MKKSLIALALMGAFSGAAVAQSNVTLYGILDVNFQRIDPSGTESATTGINSGYQSGNRFGLRGSESLGSGMNAIFTVEQGFFLDRGEQVSSRVFHRQAWAGLQFTGPNVSLVAGRLATLSSGTGSFDMIGAIDPFLTGFDGMQNLFTMAGATRADNTVAIVGGPWAGLKAGAYYSFNFNGPEAPGSGGNTRIAGVGGNYTWGPLFVAVTHDQVKHPSATGWGTGKYTQLGGTFDFKFLKLHGGYAIEDKVRTLGTANSASYAAAYTGIGRDADAWFVGLTVPLVGGHVLAMYGERDADPVAGEPNSEGPDLTHWAIGYTYPLSRRTNLYANYANKDGDGSNRVGAAGNANNAFDRKIYTVGVRHLF